MKNKELVSLLGYAAIFGNIVFILWIIYNAIDDGFDGRLLEVLSFIGLTVLLTVNSFLLINAKKYDKSVIDMQ